MVQIVFEFEWLFPAKKNVFKSNGQNPMGKTNWVLFGSHFGELFLGLDFGLHV